MEHKMLFLICASGEVFILPANSQSPKFLKRIQEKTNKQNKNQTLLETIQEQILQ